MTLRLALTTTIAAFILATSPAHAGNGNDKNKGPPSHAQQAGKHGGQHDNGRHLGWYKQQWKRGDYLPIADVDPRYYIDDYRRYDLRTPPRGYRWVRPVDGRYLLMEAATGLIAEALGY